MFDWRKLEVFLRVYETKNFSKAAKELYLSQPTVTVHLKDLEHSLGVRLLDRDTRNVIPTKAGHIVYEYGKQMLRYYREMEKELHPYKELEGGLVEIGGSTIPGQYLLPRVIKLFKEIHPKILIFLKVSDTSGVIEGVLKGEFDLGVVGARTKQSELSFEPCCGDEIVLIAPQTFPKEELDLKDLYELPLIKREEGSGTWKNVLYSLEKAGLNPSKLNIVGEMGSTEAVKSAVREGLGLSFVSKRAISLETSLNLLKEVKIKNFKINRQFYLVYFKNKHFSPATEKFFKFFKEMVS